ncbi:MAG: prolipoprotein diacylglyceryl transferase [Candidatus Omnitrophica bacterium]|nr:prolipoprotein diacylglyceryl transferase [Candidatus Omnitrophota bacterium]
MHPVLFQWGPLTLHSYGLMLAIGFLSALQLALRRARELSIDPAVVQNLAFLVLGFGIAGARAAYVLLFWEMFRGNPLEILRLDHGGLIFYGGLALGVPAGLVYLKGKGLLSWRMVDLVIPPLTLAHAIGRVGCFLNGCCYGEPFLGPWAVVFPPEGIPRHPTQLYESGFLLILFLGLKRLERSGPRPGAVALTYGFLYGAWRFGVEFLRGDNARGAWGLTAFQWASVPLIVLCGWMLARRVMRG